MHEYFGSHLGAKVVKFVAMTIQEAINHAIVKLESIYSTSEAAAISDWLIGHLTGTKKTDRVSLAKKELSEEQQSLFQAHLQRLLQNEPLQYVLNETWFCGLKFYVDKRVLIPRPETEELVEWIIAHCKFPVDELTIFDIGTGSGCIPISLKRRLGKAEVSACDISSDALEVANLNADNLGVKVNFNQINFLSEPERSKLGGFDIIVSNPPYIPENDRNEMDQNVLAYEPATALFVPDSDPMLFYKAIAEFGKTHLKNDGFIFTEIHKDMGIAVARLFELTGYTVEVKKDMVGNDRMVKAVKNFEF